MASTFHDDGHTRFWCHFEDDFEARTTQMKEGEDDENISCMDTTTSLWMNLKTYFKYRKLVLMFFHQLFQELVAT
jgi:hypothetical protein